MKSIQYVFAKEFSRFPGGRLKAHGPKSGEEFREEVLLPLLREHDHVEMDLSDVAGFGSSFLDEAFVEASREVGPEGLRAKLDLTCSDDPFLVPMIWQKIDGAE